MLIFRAIQADKVSRCGEGLHRERWREGLIKMYNHSEGGKYKGNNFDDGDGDRWEQLGSTSSWLEMRDG